MISPLTTRESSSSRNGQNRFLDGPSSPELFLLDRIFDRDVLESRTEVFLLLFLLVTTSKDESVYLRFSGKPLDLILGDGATVDWDQSFRSVIG